MIDSSYSCKSLVCSQPFFLDVTQRGALRDSTKRLRGDTSKSLANVSDDGQLIFYRIRSKLLFPLKKK